jgi:hypothetical protein
MQRGDPGVTKDLAMPSKEIIGGETAKMEWNQAVARIQNRDDGSWMTASRKARIEHPDLFAAYQRVGGAM